VDAEAEDGIPPLSDVDLVGEEPVGVLQGLLPLAGETNDDEGDDDKSDSDE
jgi:hypothetical protein